MAWRNALSLNGGRRVVEPEVHDRAGMRLDEVDLLPLREALAVRQGEAVADDVDVPASMPPTSCSMPLAWM